MNDSNEKYFDLHIDGIGYLNRARKVTPKRADAFLAVDVTALHGLSGDVQKTRFDCRVVGEAAKDVIERLMSLINDQRQLGSNGTTLRHKVLAGFHLGDLYAEPFTYQKGEREGEIGISLKARLLRLDWVKVDGNFVYQASSDAPTDQPGNKPVTSQAEPDKTDLDGDSLPHEEIGLSKAV
ncbi:MAG: DUF3577 domain-containing protein [Candidatus Thiodiazotropha sp.]